MVCVSVSRLVVSSLGSACVKPCALVCDLAAHPMNGQGIGVRPGGAPNERAGYWCVSPIGLFGHAEYIHRVAVYSNSDVYKFG